MSIVSTMTSACTSRPPRRRPCTLIATAAVGLLTRRAAGSLIVSAIFAADAGDGEAEER
ncbi:MAG: hypothetical protein V9F04_13970 [Dermatophilaceae bacterium]